MGVTDPVTSPAKAAGLRWRQWYVRSVVGCLAVLLFIHVIPKSMAPYNPLRKLWTVTYFGVLLGLCWLLMKPRAAYLQDKYERKFRDWPVSIERTWRRYLASLDRTATAFSLIAAVFIGSTGLATLNLWEPRLTPLAPWYDLAWWLSLIAFFLFLASSLLQEMAQRRQVLLEEVKLLPEQFKPQGSGRDDRSGQALEPVAVLAPGRFRAGGWEWSWQDFNLNGVIFGITGSGKTVCVLNALLEGVLGAGRENGQLPGGLILDPKGDFCDKIQVLCARLGRERDLLILDPAHPKVSIRWNPLDSADDEFELANRFAAVMETLGMKGGDTSFWIDKSKQFIQHAIALTRLTNPPDQPPSPRQIYDLASGFTRLADAAARLNVADSRCDLCLSYFADEWCELAPETRTSIQANITTMLNPFLLEPYATLFSGRSRPTMRDIVRGGKLLYVHLPVAEKETMARTVATFVKLEYFREVLRARDKEVPTLFLCDEFQKFFTFGQGNGDADFFEVSRQSRHANLIATQNLPALRKQVSKDDPVLNLLGNCATKVFLRNYDKATNEYGAEQWGEVMVRVPGGAAAGKHLAATETASGSDQLLKVVRPETFVDLAVPTKEPGKAFCESLVLLGARATVNRGLVRLRWKVHPLTGESAAGQDSFRPPDLPPGFPRF